MLDKDSSSTPSGLANIVRKNSKSNNWLQFLISEKKQPSVPKTTARSAAPAITKQDFPRYVATDFPRGREIPTEQAPVALGTTVENSATSADQPLPFNFPLKPFRNNYVALDCEMVGVDKDRKGNMLGRVSLVNWSGECIYDKYVKPVEKVTDYRTSVSGLKPSDLQGGEEFTVVQKEVASILKGKILVGHALHNDFKVLFLSHPRRKIRDTSTFHKFRQACGKRPSLKKLVSKFLNRNIQDGEHCSIEDAKATMQLFQLVCDEWESSMNGRKIRTKRTLLK